MNRITITDAADQKFAMVLNRRRVTMRVRYNPSLDRWAFDLSIDDEPVLYGRRIVTGVDLLKPFGFGIGLIFAAGSEPGRNALPAGEARLYHATGDEAV